ncbi:MAG: hypothetical protein DMG36_08015 [Acidobacteria bacterium]|nr:MAG: hypothetical protein DMG36_08015 [Acidobacteriota bacterium]
MKKVHRLATLAVFAVLLLPAGVLAQDKTEEHGSIDFGLRYAWGDVYGRPDLQTGQCLGCGSPFDPALKTSKFNEYRDVRNGFYVRRFDAKWEHVLNSKNNYVSLKSQRTLYRDQSYLATFGEYGKFKLQFRYDEIPHIYSDTARTLFTETAPGVWGFPAAIRSALQASTPSNLPSLLAGTGANAGQGIVTDFDFITPSIIRKAGTALFSYNPTAKWNLNLLFWRESERGTRPLGLIMNPSPSASATAGYGVELPEPINYFNNRLQFGTEYGNRSRAIQIAYIGSFLQNNTGVLTWDNPFRLTNETVGNPLTGRMDLYPDNKAQYLSFAGATNVTKYMRLMGSVSPGWLRQNDAFLPYTTNTANVTCGDGTQACTSLSSLPAASLGGSKQTLAMNFTLVTTAWKSVEAKAAYRHYDYTNNTPVHTFTPVEGDAGGPVLTPTDNTPFSFNRKNLELTGNWFFAKRSSFKLGYEAEWMDRSQRDASHSLENSIVSALDYSPTKNWLLRLSYRHSDRKPDLYLDDVSEEISGGIPVDSPFARRFDEAARLRDRADGLIQYNATDKLTVSAFGGTLQDNYNQPGGSNNATPLNFLTGTTAATNPYYLYGVLKDLSYNWGLDLDYAVLAQMTVFAEYSHERYHKRMITRYRAPESTSGTGGCGPNTLGTANQGACDTANNDWESTSRELVDITSAGVDFYFGKKVYLTTYYSLSAVKGNVFSRFLGDPLGHPNQPPADDPDRFMLVGTNAAVDYPETVNRTHEVAIIFKYKLTANLTPRFEYRYQQWDNKDYQTSPMTQYMGCVSPIPNANPPSNSVPGCTTPVLTSNTPTPVAVPSSFYPYFVVGDTSAARYLFMGTDQPSYKAHTLLATLEYRF